MLCNTVTEIVIGQRVAKPNISSSTVFSFSLELLKTLLYNGGRSILTLHCPRIAINEIAEILWQFFKRGRIGESHVLEMLIKQLIAEQ